MNSSALTHDEFKPSPKSYGASVFVLSLLTNGVETLFEARPDWLGRLAPRIRVERILTINGEIRVKLTPMDCQLEAIREAHASIANLNRERRAELAGC